MTSKLFQPKAVLIDLDGTVLPLDRDLDAPLDVMVNGTVVAHAEVVQVDGKFALRITEVLKNDSQEARG